MSALFRRRPPAGPEQQFWSWFAGHEAELFALEGDPGQVFARLNMAAAGVHQALTFEFGPVVDGVREFVISADGIRAAFPAVQALHAAAPDLPRWRFVKFRPRRRPMTVLYGGHALEPDALRFALEPDDGKVAVTVYIPGLDPQEPGDLMGVAFLMLDQALGEFDVETKAGRIELAPAPRAPAGALGIDELPEAFDRMVAALRR